MFMYQICHYVYFITALIVNPTIFSIYHPALIIVSLLISFFLSVCHTHLQTHTIRQWEGGCESLPPIAICCHLLLSKFLWPQLTYIFLCSAVWIGEQHLHLPAGRHRDQGGDPHRSCSGDHWQGPEAHTWTGAQSKSGRYLNLLWLA